MAYDGARIKDLVRDVPGFPRPGVTFKDITPLLADRESFAAFCGKGVPRSNPLVWR